MRPILATFLVLLLASCASTPIDTNPNASASDLYQNAMHLLNHKDYNTAIKEFQTLEARYPYGIYSTQAQLDVAYAYYKQDDQESANEACDSFIKLHPNNPHVDYAYYLKGLANFNYHSDFMSRISHQDMALRDPKETRASFFAFRTLITRFPKSRYAPDARQRLVFLVNELSHYEISVGRYYLKRGAWVAAANRAKYVLVHYPESNQARNALLLEIAAYQKLGLTHLANDTEKVLHLNFPDSRPVAQASAGEHHKA
ncbi:MAG: outer membrane protein assembly factor BamD, partial [Pseudomonadota bacterium]|nr:outer membrane protein assembly factor BamD [Pseudomonadota bacterium]